MNHQLKEGTDQTDRYECKLKTVKRRHKKRHVMTPEVKTKLNEVTFNLVVKSKPVRWPSPSASGCGLKDNRPTESLWHNVTITLILPFVCLSICAHVTQSQKQTGTMSTR